MPSFREKMINKLRTPEQGADTMVWACCYKDLETNEAYPNGCFLQGTDHLSYSIINNFLLIKFNF